MQIIIEEWDGGGATRIPDEALQDLERDVGDSLYLIENLLATPVAWFYRKHLKLRIE
jgi:hypothetical protein